LGWSKRIVYACSSLVLPIVLFVRLAQTAWARKRNFKSFVKSAPVTFFLLMYWSAGEATGYVAGLGASKKRHS
jgi:hypothetical protein